MPSNLAHPVHVPWTSSARPPGTNQNQHPVVRWLVDPKNRKAVLGGGGLAVAVLLIISGSGLVALLGVVLAITIWATLFRLVPSDTASFRIRTHLDEEEIAGLAAEVAADLSGPFSRVILQSGTVDRLEMVITGAMSEPLEFYVHMVSRNDGTITVSTEIETWTKNRFTVWFIPVPFVNTIDGFRLYKRFGDRWSSAIAEFDPRADVEYLQKT